ncbi:MAG TPA: hypothetical protein VH599_03890 [Ktedonobacterales bacterium]
MTEGERISGAHDAQRVDEQTKPLQVARARRRLASSLFRLGPIPLGIIGAILISLLALLYLNEVGLATQARLRLQELANQQTQLQQQNQQLREQQGILQSPGYIVQQAIRMGMIPEDPARVHTIVIPGPP